MFSAGEWRHRAEQEILRLIIAEEFAATQREKDIIRLKKLMWNIEPYSRWWRWGYVGTLKRAIRALDGTDKAGKAARETGGEEMRDRKDVIRCEACRHWTGCDTGEDERANYGVCGQLGRMTHRGWFCGDAERESDG